MFWLRLSALGSLLFAACATPQAPVDQPAVDLATEIERVLNENPQIVFGLIEQNPKLFFDTLNTAAVASRQQEADAEAERQTAQIEGDLLNPVSSGDLTGRVYLGDVDAQLEVVIFSDTRCPYCKEVFETLLPMLEEYPFRVVYRHMSVHGYAPEMGAYIEGANEQDPRFGGLLIREVYTDQFQERVAQAADLEGVLQLMDAALIQAGGDPLKARKAAQSDRVLSLLAQDEEEATALGFAGTPAIIASGVRLEGAYPRETFEMIFERRLE